MIPVANSYYSGGGLFDIGLQKGGVEIRSELGENSPCIPYEATPPSVASCGTIVGEEYKASMTWSGVTCKRCLNVKDRLQLSFEQTEEIIIEQMGDAVKFFESKEEE